MILTGDGEEQPFWNLSKGFYQTMGNSEALVLLEARAPLQAAPAFLSKKKEEEEKDDNDENE